jgi:hypothetical protein
METRSTYQLVSARPQRIMERKRKPLLPVSQHFRKKRRWKKGESDWKG